MCTTTEWCELRGRRSARDQISRRSARDQISNLIQTDRFWKKAREVQNIMNLLVRVLKIVDQDKKQTLSIIYEAMDRAKLAIKASNTNQKKYWDIIDKRWERQLHRHLHAAGNSFTYLQFIIVEQKLKLSYYNYPCLLYTSPSPRDS